MKIGEIILVELLRKIKQLEEKFELMKCCENCYNIDIENWNNCDGCVGTSKWEMKK